MDGKLTGCLSPRLMLTGRLSLMPRVEPVLIEKTLQENGTYHASDDGADGYSTVIADIHFEPPVLIKKAIRENGTYHASDDGADGYSTVTADIHIEPPTLIEKTVRENGTYHASDDDADGFSSVIVDVIPEPPALIEKTIIRNGTYHASDDGVDGFSSIIANVPAEPMEPRAFDLEGGYIANGIWTPGGDTVCYSDSYAVSADNVYILSLGSVLGTRFRAMFSVEDIAAETSQRVAGRQLINTSNPLPYAYVVHKPASDGFITVTKDNAGRAGIRTYMFCLTDLVRGNE